MITPDRIRALCSNSDAALIAQVAPALDAGLATAQITTPLRVAHFMGQLAVESAYFTRMVENLNYRAARICQIWSRLCPRAPMLEHNPTALGNAAYANRYGNGDEASGDGFRYRGRGLIQLTFRDNYHVHGERIGVNLEDDPDLAATPTNASFVAFSFWSKANCNHYADLDDVRAVTRAINGGENALTERSQYTQKAKGIFV